MLKIAGPERIHRRQPGLNPQTLIFKVDVLLETIEAERLNQSRSRMPFINIFPWKCFFHHRLSKDMKAGKGNRNTIILVYSE